MMLYVTGGLIAIILIASATGTGWLGEAAEAQKAIIVSGVIVTVQFAIFLLVGLALWGYYQGAPPAELGLNRDDEIVPLFIIEGMPAGLSGLLLAGILAAAMSTLSSLLTTLRSSTVTEVVATLRHTAHRPAGAACGPLVHDRLGPRIHRPGHDLPLRRGQLRGARPRRRRHHLRWAARHRQQACPRGRCEHRLRRRGRDQRPLRRDGEVRDRRGMGRMAVVPAARRDRHVRRRRDAVAAAQGSCAGRADLGRRQLTGRARGIPSPGPPRRRRFCDQPTRTVRDEATMKGLPSQALVPSNFRYRPRASTPISFSSWPEASVPVDAGSSGNDAGSSETYTA